MLAPEPGTLWLEAASGGSGAAGAAAAAAPALLRVDLADEDAIAALPQVRLEYITLTVLCRALP